MVQGNDSLEVQSKTQLDSFDSSSSCDEHIDAHVLNEELSIVCEKLIEKYKLLKKKTFALNKEYLLLASNFDFAFTVWNMLTTTTTTSKLQVPIQQEEETSGESESQCYMVQGMTPLRYNRKLN